MRRYQLSLRFQMFNVFNRHTFAGPNTQIGSTDFGKLMPYDLNGTPGPRVVAKFGARDSLFRRRCLTDEIKLTSQLSHIFLR